MQTAGRLAIGMPASALDAPPGYYLLFTIDTTGVPSNGLLLAVGGNTAAPPVPSLLPRGNTITLASYNLPDYAVATNAGLGVLKLLGQNPTLADKQIARGKEVEIDIAHGECAVGELLGDPADRDERSPARLPRCRVCAQIGCVQRPDGPVCNL